MLTITLNQPVENDALLLRLSDAMINVRGLALDGEWLDGISTVSGNGNPGGEFSIRLDVLPGDVDDNNGINLGGDVLGVFALNDTVPSNVEQAYFDIDGSGGINLGSDALAVFARNDLTLPLPPARAAARAKQALLTDMAIESIFESDASPFDEMQLS